MSNSVSRAGDDNDQMKQHDGSQKSADGNPEDNVNGAE